MAAQIQNNRSTVVSINGQFVPAAEATVSAFDRSFLYGDSLYEVVRTYQGKPFRLKEHLKRLEKSAALCQMQFSQTMEEYEREMLKAIDRYRAQPGKQNEDVYVRLVISRGSGKIGFGLANVETPSLYVIYVEPISMFPNKPFEQGSKLQISARTRNLPNALDPAMKSGNYLNSLLAYLTAARAGYDDALMLDYQGFMTEGTTYNIFYVNRGIVATAPLDVGILDGVTRRALINLCIELAIPCREVRFPKEYLYEADEVFVSSSLKEVLPVLDLDGRKIGGGKAGPVTLRLKEAFDALVRKELGLG
jgi:branched-chain amino acid aminotransferase